MKQNFCRSSEVKAKEKWCNKFIQIKLSNFFDSLSKIYGIQIMFKITTQTNAFDIIETDYFKNDF